MGAELDRVVDQVGDRLPQLAHVPESLVLRLHPDLEVDAAALRLAPLLLEHRRDQPAHLEVLAMDGLPPALERGEVDQVVDGSRETLRRRGDRFQNLLLLVAQRAGLPAAQDLEVPDDGSQRRRHLVRQVLHELVLAARGRPESRVGRGQLSHRGLQALDQRLAVLAQVPPLFRPAHLLALPLEERAQLLGKLLHVDRLLDVAVAPDGQRQPAIAVARQHHDRTAVQTLVGAQAGGRLVAVDPRELDVAKDQVGVGGDRQVDPRDAVGGLQDVESPRLEDAAHQRPAFRVVLDIEDPRCRRQCWIGHR